jgi:septal ring-binding cell division protein DamX
LQDSAIYYKSKKNSTDLFVLIQGSFESFSQATRIISQLPPEVKESKPWVRPIGIIKEAIQAQ